MTKINLLKLKTIKKEKVNAIHYNIEMFNTNHFFYLQFHHVPQLLVEMEEDVLTKEILSNVFVLLDLRGKGVSKEVTKYFVI